MMNNDDYNTANTNVSNSDGKKTDAQNAPVYRVLGESGLVEDEEGNIFSASEIDDDDTTERDGKYTPPAAFTESSFVSALDDKANPAYWYYYYDPRYCGPSREAYMEKMARQHRHTALEEKEKAKEKEEPVSPVVSSPQKEKPSIVSEAARRKADENQREADRKGLRPDFHSYSNARRSCGMVNRNNEVLISYDEYSEIGYFHNGLARVLKKKTGKFGFIDPHGKEVIPCTWKSAGEFSEYMAGVQDDFRKCGYVDVTGRLAIRCVWEECWPFHEGLARVQNNRMIGMIDPRGKLIVPCIWKGMGDFSEGLIGVQDTDGKCGYIDRSGKVVIPCQWKNVWTFSEGLAVVQDFNKLLGFINTSGELVIPCQWKRVEFFKNGLAKVSKTRSLFGKDKWVYIDKQGRVVK